MTKIRIGKLNFQKIEIIWWEDGKMLSKIINSPVDSIYIDNKQIYDIENGE